MSKRKEDKVFEERSSQSKRERYGEVVQRERICICRCTGGRRYPVYWFDPEITSFKMLHLGKIRSLSHTHTHTVFKRDLNAQRVDGLVDELRRGITLLGKCGRKHILIIAQYSNQLNLSFTKFLKSLYVKTCWIGIYNDLTNWQLVFGMNHLLN